MPNRTRFKRILDIVQGIRWLLRDDFNDTQAVDTINGTSATPGPGTRTIVSPDNSISTSGGNLVANWAANWNNFYFLNGVVAKSGQMLFFHFNRTSGTHNQVGISNVFAGAPSKVHAFYPNSGTLQVVHGDNIVANIMALGNFSSATDYYYGIVNRNPGAFFFIKGGSFTNWTLIWVSDNSVSSTVYPYARGNASVCLSKFMRIPSNLWLPSPLVSDSFNRVNGTIGNTDGFGHAELNGGGGLTWTGATYTISTNKAINTPAEGTEILTNGGMETFTGGLANGYWKSAGITATQEGTIIHGGSSSQKLVASGVANEFGFTLDVDANTWVVFHSWVYIGSGGPVTIRLWNSRYEKSFSTTGSWNEIIVAGHRNINRPATNTTTVSTFYVDDWTVKPLTLSNLFSSVACDINNVIAEVALTMPSNCGTPAGIALCLDSTSNPQNFILVYHTGSSLVLEKFVNGTSTVIAQASAAYSAGAKIIVIKNGTSVSMFYNGTQISTVQTISDATIINNTKHGLFSTYSGNTLDNFVVWSVGNEGQYNAILDKYIQP